MTQKDLSKRLSAPITGFVDYSLQQQYLFNLWLQKVQTVYESFGFTPLHLKPFEHLEALQGEGETQKQIFEVYRADTGQTTGLALPFDHTVPLALWIAEHAGHLQNFKFPYKRYDMGLSYRGERPKTGRFRAFVQADVDIVGKHLSLSADVECIASVISAINSLEVGSIQVHINHIAVVKSILNQHLIEPQFHEQVLRCIDKLDKLTSSQVAAELKKIPNFSSSHTQIEDLLQVFTKTYPFTHPFPKEHFAEDAALGLSQLEEMKKLLEITGQNLAQFTFSPRMVRGLSYYTGIVFETFLENKEQYGSIASGGRYSNLVGQYAKSLQDIEGVGASIGLTRLFDIMSKTDTLENERATMAEVLVGARTEGEMPLAYELAKQLRSKGKRVDIYSGTPKVKQILNHANALKIPNVAIVMDASAIVIKDMQSQNQQEFTTIGAAVDVYS